MSLWIPIPVESTLTQSGDAMAVKLECPKCGKSLEYLPDEIVQCGQCKHSVRMPSLDGVSPQVQEVWAKQQAKLDDRKKHAEAERKRFEALKQRDANVARTSAAKPQAAAAVPEPPPVPSEKEPEVYGIQAPASGGRAAGSAKRFANRLNRRDSELKAKRYRWITIQIVLCKIALWLCFVLGGLLVVLSVMAMFSTAVLPLDDATSNQNRAFHIGFMFGYGIGLLLLGCWMGFLADIFTMAMDAARDLRLSRSLLTKLG